MAAASSALRALSEASVLSVRAFLGGCAAAAAAAGSPTVLLAMVAKILGLIGLYDTRDGTVHLQHTNQISQERPAYVQYAERSGGVSVGTGTLFLASPNRHKRQGRPRRYPQQQ